MTPSRQRDNAPIVRSPELPATRQPPAATTSEGWLLPATTDGILFGGTMAGIGFLFTLIFLISEIAWGSYFGANPGVGLSLSIGVLILGVAVATILWIVRELSIIARIHR